MVNGTGISIGGLGSGLDTQAIVAQLVALERLPIQQLEIDRDITQDKVDKLGIFKNLVTQLQDKAEELGSLAGFLNLAITGGDENVATVSAGESALQGSHSLDVQRLASIDRWAFDGVVDSTADLATVDGQSVSFTVGTTVYDITVNADDSSLIEIASQINTAAGDEVTASVVNTGTESNPSFQLVMASKASGEEGRIFGISTTIDGLNIDGTAPDANGDATSASNITVGNNALATIDGLAIERSSNDFSDVIDGVNIDLVGLGASTFGVEPDKEAMRDSMNEFLSAYNDVISFIGEQNTFVPAANDDEDPEVGALFGDTSLRTVKQTLTNSLFNIPIADVISDVNGYSTLSLVGITQDSDGKLTLDNTKFDAKISEDIGLLADLFVDTDGFIRDPNAVGNTAEYFVDTTEDSGLLNTLVRNIDQLVGRLDDGDSGINVQGIFDLRKSTFEDKIKRIGNRIQAKETALVAFREDLVMRYARLESLMGGLNAQGMALTAALG
ncbi:MAG: flagellar filament capping protein FliD [Planctomycetes bacterium]|nr:flagellar filament capping protein FliD [Planctomycetota bacterium]